jgi:TolB protein
MNRSAVGLILAFVFAAACTSSAQVRVSKGAGHKTTIDWSSFGGSPTAAGSVFKKTLQDDLIRSGWFTPAARGQGFLVLQGLYEDDGSDLSVKCYVFETQTRQNYLSKSYRAGGPEARRLAHKVADEIIEAVTGKKGICSGRLLVVGNRTKNKEVYLCDPDGQNVVQLTRDGKISLAPKWGPDGNTIVYTSYLKGYPDVYSIDVASGSRKKLAGYPGLNTGADISPNGREVALILSKDGNPELYVKNLRSGELTRLTSSPRAAEASPSWSPDGNQIVYVSDQSGTPQLYILSRDGGRPARMTSRGSENVAPDWGANGWIAYTTRVGGRYQVCVMDPNSGVSKQITSEDADFEDPCWSPDGRHLACGRSRQYHSAIYLLDTLGDPPIALLDTQGDWFSPAWSAK